MELDSHSWNKLESEFRKKVCVWAELQTEEAKYFTNDNERISSYLKLADASTSAARFEQQWKRSIGDPRKVEEIAEGLRDASYMFRKPQRLIHTAMACTRAELRHGRKFLRESNDIFEYESKLEDIWNTIDNKGLVIDHAVYALYIAWKPDSKIIVPDNRKSLLRSLAIDDSMFRVISPRKFEELIAYLYECFGCKVELTPQSRILGLIF